MRIIMLYYDIHENYFVNEDSDVVDSIFSDITPDMLRIFRHNERSMVFPHPSEKGVSVELFYPTGCYACFTFECPDNPCYEGNDEEE